MEASGVRKIIIAMDFGTTFSGVAWAQTNNPDVHYLINQWPDGDSSTSIGGMTSEKVPTEIAYEYKRSSGSEPSEPKPLWDCRNASVPHHTTPEGAVTDYLRCLREHVVSLIESKVGSLFERFTLEDVITVPAIWADKAKTATMSCAKEAGFGETLHIHIVSEPEAAAIHALKASNPHGIEVGDTIVICDAGGGTVDLITFAVTQLKPHLRLKEQAPGIGALCGSTFLNRRFEEFLKERLSSSEEWEHDTLEEAMCRFELVAKRSFAGNPDDEFMIPVPGLADNKEKGIRRGRIRVTGSEMIDLFQPSLQDVRDLVKDQVNTSKAKVKAIFLVGGFGQNPYLRKTLLESFPGINVLAPVDGWTAVVRGALAKAMIDISPLTTAPLVESRVARKHYGMIKNTKFIEGLHDDQRKYWDYFRGEFQIQVMDWYIRKGDDIKEDSPIMTSYYRVQLAEDGPFAAIHTKFYELDTSEPAPLYFDRRMKMHAVLHPSFDGIEQSRMSTHFGKDGERYYRIDYEIHASYFSAHCEYPLWYEGANHGNVKVDYV
ncbi:hypothetical protein BJX96DRAFT_181405 [Aspergillus floccosus]